MVYTSSSSLKAICLLVFVLVGSVSSQSTVCPFDFLFHLGDGVFDNGNAIAIPPFGSSLPAASLPYGVTYPGNPTGRWCDGLLDIDVGATAMGFPVLTPYLGGNASSNNAIIFAVARSPVLDRSFFMKRGVRIPPYAQSLSVQMSWFKRHIDSICTTPQDCADKVADSLVLFGDVEANDITFPLRQGKTIRQVRRYVTAVTRAQINAAREVIGMGATRVILPGNVPIGCYPFILTELSSSFPADYDSLGCLKKVNDLIVYKNNDLQNSIANLQIEFPNITIFYADFYSAFQTLLREVTSGKGPNKSVALKSCCGAGGKYNYDLKRFCGSPKASTCSDPNQYIYWDGIHLTQAANDRLSVILQEGAFEALNCTTAQTVTSVDYLRMKGMKNDVPSYGLSMI
ncbi:hypothetical protein RD792_000888 [Penstemon davidsonii]|uniref:Uncharacterized protein n=1 Tax=Penstemon davidsonii TaxID=160366 RepID=A0ABR0DN44_9LAMI|nr:hypothetical protein RD792_000888 [Penstemon davidsonii]